MTITSDIGEIAWLGKLNKKNDRLNKINEANANLIASAPKQNEALIWVAEWLGIRKPDGGKPNRADVIRIVKEALAKAKPE